MYNLELPVFPGQRIWIVRSVDGHRVVVESEIQQLVINAEYRWNAYNIDGVFLADNDMWGDLAFATKSEAEAAAKTMTEKR